MAYTPEKGNVEGLTGSLIQMFSHGINVIGLFFIAEILLGRTGTREISKLGGIRNVNTLFTSFFLIIMMGSVALPLTNGFIGEFLLINGVYQFSTWAAVFAGLTIIVGAVYMLRSFQGIMLGETNSTTANFGSELTMNEKAVLFIVAAAVIVFGVYPNPLLDILHNDVAQLAQQIAVK